MDFVEIKEKYTRNGTIEIYPNFRVKRCKDLMVRGKAFYAIWDQEKGMWSTDEYDVQRLVDKELQEYAEKKKQTTNIPIHCKFLGDFSSKMWSEFQNYISHLSESAHTLDEKITFANTEVRKDDYVSKRLPYSIEEGTIKAYDELIGTLYSEEERDKLEWAIGAIISGDAKNIQKFIVLYGEGGTGKSTVLNIIEKLFNGYYTTFEAKALASTNNSFATESFKSNPLVALQHDGDLSKIEDNTKLNSIISHEMMTMNEKYKASYMARTNCFLFMGTNKPVKITDAKSGIIRRLIDVRPTGTTLPPKKYNTLKEQIDFELGAIAQHCLNKYRSMGKNYYAGYRAVDMILKTDVFYNFVESEYYTFKEQNGTTLSSAYEMYKQYCDEALVDFKLPKYKFREELKNYFKYFYDITRIDGKQVRSYYSEFLYDKFEYHKIIETEEHPYALVIDKDISLFDEIAKNYPSQYANSEEVPSWKWANVKTKLKDIDSKKLHYVKLPENHIVIDFDLKDENGNKSYEKNLEAASKWPPTYAELSKGGNGIHLHYIYKGDSKKLSNLYDNDIEIKVFTGNSSLRRKLSKCNDIPIATINSGLPLKGEKMVDFTGIKNEKAIRTLIIKNLNKESHSATKPSVDFIYKILEDAYTSGVHYDVSDMRPAILAFANNSTHNSSYCVDLVSKMKFHSEDPSENIEPENKDIIFWDIECFPNLFLVEWKVKGPEHKVVRMYNPKPKDIEPLLKNRLIGFNNRRYDNHMLYAAYIGYNNEQLFRLSQRLVSNSKNATFREAYNLSFADVYDFSTKKQSLKKWEIELGLHHEECSYPWDQPVPEDKWSIVGDYCENDVKATEAVFDFCQADFMARELLADLSGLPINSSTRSHTEKIIFGNDQNPQSKLVYTDLSKEFPGYKFDNGKSSYKDEDPGEGGYVYANPGMYYNVALLDVKSMHPHTMKALNLFGPYTKRFVELIDARVAIKEKRFDDAQKMLDGKLSKYLKNQEQADKLAYALKIVINTVYGLTAAKFDNKFRDTRNKDNIVAKRGALFMINLKHEVQERGFTVAHIKTDSIKIPNATKEIIEFCMEYAKKYGYEFEHEATYDRMCLVNNAVYIAKDSKDKHWTAVGAQFAHPYVFKTLFSKEPLEFKDFCETKTVTSTMYLDMNEQNPEEHDLYFVGKAGLFCPIKPGKGGGLLVKYLNEKYDSVTGTKDYRWMESETVKSLGKEKDIDIDYFRHLVDDAIDNISKYGDFEQFVSDDDTPPWE